jgi:hypothetical protein
MTDKEIIKKMMEKTEQKLLDEDDYYLDYENAFVYGNIISFMFDETGKLLKVTGN